MGTYAYVNELLASAIRVARIEAVADMAHTIAVRRNRVAPTASELGRLALLIDHETAIRMDKAMTPHPRKAVRPKLTDPQEQAMKWPGM